MTVFEFHFAFFHTFTCPSVCGWIDFSVIFLVRRIEISVKVQRKSVYKVSIVRRKHENGASCDHVMEQCCKNILHAFFRKGYRKEAILRKRYSTCLLYVYTRRKQCRQKSTFDMRGETCMHVMQFNIADFNKLDEPLGEITSVEFEAEIKRAFWLFRQQVNSIRTRQATLRIPCKYLHTHYSELHTDLYKKLCMRFRLRIT